MLQFQQFYIIFCFKIIFLQGGELFLGFFSLLFTLSIKLIKSGGEGKA